MKKEKCVMSSKRVLKKVLSVLLCLFLFNLSNGLLAVVKGSESAVSIEPYNEFPAIDSDNKIAGFAWFKNGFSLENSATECIFDAVYPVSGNIDLNGGTLSLSQDLSFKNTTNLLGLGKIIGNDHLLEFCSSIYQLPTGQTELEDVVLSLANDLLLTDTLLITGNCKIFGSGYDIDLGDSGYIIVAAGAQLHLVDLVLEGVRADNVIMTDDTSCLMLENTKWKQVEDHNFTTGSIAFLNENDFIGSYDFVYDSARTSTIHTNSKWAITEGLTLKIGRKSSSQDPEPICFEDNSAILRLESCTFLITSFGMMLKTGKVEVDNDVDLEVIGTDTTTGLVLGSGIQAEDFTMHLNAGASLKFKSGQLMYNNYGDTGLTAFSESARIIRYSDSKMYVAQNWKFPALVLKVASGVPETILKDGVIFSYEGSKLSFSSVEYDFYGHQSGSYNFFLNGGDYLYLTKGTFLTPLVVSGTNNNVYGVGNLTGNVILQDSDSEVIFNLNGLILSDVYLSGGKATLARDLKMGAKAIFASAGTIDLSTYNFELSGLDSVWTSTITWENNGGALNLKSNVNLSGIWTFDDSCIINGNGHTIDVGHTGQILVGNGAQLTLRNVILHMVSQDDIRCLDNNSSIVIDNTAWVQDTDVIFDTGSLKFVNQVDFIGTYSFIYDSTRTCTIASNSTWNITGGIKAYLGKKTATSAEPICFESSTSKLRLDDCHFISTGYGMCLKKGNIDIDKNVTLDIVGTTTSTGLMLGSGNAEDNIVAYLSSGCEFNFRSGQMVYNNTVDNGFVALSESAQVIRYANSKFYSMSDLVFPEINIKIESGAPVTQRADGATYRYEKSHVTMAGAQFDFRGQQATSTMFLLEGNDYIYMNKGTFILPITVSGSENQIFGTGNISGPIFLANSDAELSFNLNGILLNNITLNGGNVKLDGDLTVGGDYKFNGQGTVGLKEYNITFGMHDTVWTSTITWECGCGGTMDHCDACPRSIKLNSHVCLDGQWQFANHCIINGNGNTLHLHNGGKLIINDGVKLTLRDIKIRIEGGDVIQLLGDTSCLELDNVIWVQESDFNFPTGSIKFENNVDFRGGYSFIYDSSQTSTIGVNSTWKITKDMALHIGRKEVENYAEPLYMEDGTAVLKLDNCSFVVTATGMQLTNGKVVIDKDVNLSIIGTTTATGLTLGNGLEENDVRAVLSSGACLHFREGQLVYNNYANDKFTALSESARVIRYGPSYFHMATDLVFPAMHLKVASGFPTTTRASEAVSLRYDKSRLIFENVEFDFKGRQDASNTFLLEGDGYLYLSKGVFMLPFSVSGANNQIFGTGNVSGGVALADSDTNLICDLNGVLWNTTSLNGGNLTLMGDLLLGGDYTIQGPGQVRLMRYNLMLGSQDSSWTTDLSWHSNGLYRCPFNFPRGIDLNSRVNLSGTWTFQDCCTINGHGHMLELGENGKIEVEDGVCLTLRDIILHSSGKNNISCLGDNSSITFDNVTWHQDSDATFELGSIKFVNSVDFVGTHSFVYDSMRTSTITEDSHWKISRGMTLRIGKKSEASENPLYFDGRSAYLKLDDCRFLTTGSGFEFLRGTFEVANDVYLDVTGTTTHDGFIFGNGVADDDGVFRLTPGSTMHFNNGMFQYNVGSTNGFIALADTATIIRYGGTSAHVNTDWTIPNLVIKAALGFPETIVRPGVHLRYANTSLTFSESYFEYTGSQSATTGFFVLEGNDYIFIDKGAFIFPISVTGSGNRIYGAGGFNGIIVLEDSNAELTFAINGTLGTSAQMNGGTIKLGDDLYLTGGATMLGSGKIDIDGYKIAFGSQDLIWADPVFWDGGNSGYLDIRSKVDLLTTWTFSGKFAFNGYGNIIDLSNGGNIVIDKDAQVTFRNIKITGVSGNNMRCADNSSIMVFDDATWVQNGDFVFEKGRMKFVNDVDFIGSYSFVYDSTQTSTVTRDSSWRVAGGMVFNVGKEDTDAQDPIYFESSTSHLKLDNCTFLTKPAGFVMTRGIFDMYNDVYLDITGTNTTNGFTFGTGVRANDGIFKLNPGCTLHFINGMFMYNDYSKDGFVALSENATIIRYGGTSAYINTDWTIPFLQIKAALGFPETIIRPGVSLRYDNTHLTFSSSYFEYTGSQSATTGFFVLEDDDYIFIDKGAFIFPISVTGTGNKIYGAGGFNGIIQLADSNAELIFAINGTLGTSAQMNGGTIKLGDDLYLTGGATMLGSGKIDLDGYKIAFGSQDLTWTDPMFWDGGSSGFLDIRSRLDLLTTWTLSGEFTLNGYGNILNISDGNIVIDNDSNITFRNIKITGISGTNIRCLGDDSVITLDDAIWVQDGNYTFTIGALRIEDNVSMEGAYEFAYQTKMTSTVFADSTWRFGTGFTLDYDPSVDYSKDLIQLYDQTSSMKFVSSYLHTNTAGINFKKGNVIIKGETTFSSDILELDDGEIVNEGITFGSGTQADDCVLQVLLGSNLKVSEGAFVYNNVSDLSFVMENQVSSMKIFADTEFKLNQNVDLGLGRLYISEHALLTIASGKNIIGSTFIMD